MCIIHSKKNTSLQNFMIDFSMKFIFFYGPLLEKCHLSKKKKNVMQTKKINQ